MDPADLAGPTTTASATESSMVVEKTVVLPEKIEKEVKTSSDKNGSAPDSTVAKEKSPADVPKEGFQSTLKKPLEESEHKALEQNSKDDSKSPVKQPVSTTATATVDEKPEKMSGNSADASSSSCQGKETSATQEDDSENDDLLLRLEALEKGEDPDLINVQKKKGPEVNHQNGLTEQPAAEVPMAKSKDSAKEAGATESNASPQANSKPAKVETSPKKVSADEHTPVTSKEAISPAVESVESVSSNAKRKHSVSEPEMSSTEPQTKKVHVGDVPDCPEPAVVKAASLENLSSSSAKASIASTSDGAPPSEESRMQGTDENPPSVEKMDVDVSPESQSSPDNLETLPDTEPNTEPDDKLEEISSSVAEEPTRTDSSSDNAPGKSDNSNVSSSDDKRTGPNGKAKPPDSEVSASVVPTASEDEPMDVDEADTAGSSSATVVGTVSEVAVPVVEPLCVKKVAYLCTDEDNTDGPSKDVKNPSTASPTKPAVASTSVTGSTTTLAPSTSKDKTEMDSPKKASSSSVSVGKPVVQSEAVEVDSSNKPSSENASSVSSASASTTTTTTKKVMDESIVESSSQPSSTSDSQKKKQLSDDRLNEQQLREAVHRSGLMAKASSTPNSNAAALVAASSSPLTPKTLHPVTTSAVSSSNVYSSTPIHANFEKVSSGNVSKITNPPSSVETSRVEADETMTTTTTANTTVGQSASSVVALGEEKETTSTTTTATESATKSSVSVTPTKGDATVATGSSSTSKSSPPPKKDMLKREESSSTSSSSLKTTDLSEVDSCTVASAMNTAEEINMYTTNARKFNGISSTSEGSELDIKSDGLKVHKPATTAEADETKVSLSSTMTKLDLSGAISASTSAEQQYEVSVWYEGKDLQFLSVERIHSDKVESSSSFEPCTTAGTTAVTQDASSIIDSSSKQSSSTTNGSVSSFGPFPLPQNRASHADSVAHSSDSSSTSGGTTGGVAKSPTSTLSVPQVKQTVIGPKALCDLLIDEFKKLRRTFAPDVKDEEEEDSHHRQVDEQLLHTPKASGSAARGQRGGSSSTSKKSVAARGQKRSKAADSDEDDDGGDGEQRTPRASGTSSATKQSAKKAKSGESPTITSTATPKAKHPEEHKFDLCCLARWTDRKYYAGRVTNFRGDNKYVVVFEDGCSKTLSRDIIVFGEDGVLPILNHSIHALTGGDTYEPAIVEEIKRSDGGDAGGEVVYAVRTASSKLEVTATDIYLTDEQAKWIHNSLKGKPDPMEKLLQSTAAAGTESSPAHAAGDGPTAEGENASEHGTDHATGEKGARSTRSKRGGAGDKTPLTPEAGFSGGVGKKGRRGRRKQLPPPEPNISECSDVSDGYEDEVPTPVSPESGLDAVDGVQPELQRTEQESELARMMLVSEYFGEKLNGNLESSLGELLGPIPVGAKTLFRNKHFLLSCTIPLKRTSCNGDSTEVSKYKQFSNIPFVKQHVRRQIEAGGGKVYQFFEDVPKNKYKMCKLIAPRPSTTALYVQCLACDIPIVSHEWIVQCCQVLMLVDHKPYTLPYGWSFLEKRFIDWGSRRAKDKRNSATPFASTSINVASLCKDFNDFWSRVCKLGGATVRLIKTESDVTENLTGYLLTDQEFPEDIKIKAARNGLLVVSTVWVVQSLILGRVCDPQSHEKLTQIYQEDDY